MNGNSEVNSCLGSQSLLQRYRPQRLEDFVGLEMPRQVLTGFVDNPFSSSWLFCGPSGLGKTSMGMVLADKVRAQLHHIPAKSCNLETVEEVCRGCYYPPCQPDDWAPMRFHLCLIDEANEMSFPSQLAFLSRLDGTATPPQDRAWCADLDRGWLFWVFPASRMTAAFVNSPPLPIKDVVARVFRSTF